MSKDAIYDILTYKKQRTIVVRLYNETKQDYLNSINRSNPI